MPELQLVQKELKEAVVKEALKSSEECGEAALKEFKEKYEESILATYVDEKNNYIVDGAIIRCDQMSDKDVYISYEEGKKILYGEGGRAEELDPDVKKEIFEYFFKANSENEEVQRLSAVHATEQADNGIPFATVSDCTCLREVEDCKKRGRKPASQASIVSLGNCKIMKSSDIREIEKRADKAREYGTCYCLIQPASEWVNPYCIEGLEGNCDGETETDYVVCEDITSYIAFVTRKVCNDDSHHNTMEWSTKEGQKEGLTLLSTLLCSRGGRITIEVSGQSIVGFNLEESLKIMEQYLQGEVSEEMLNIIIPWVAENCGLTVNDMKGGGFSKEVSQKYDDQIIAWTYYWNCKLEKEREGKKSSENEFIFEIDPNIVKAMIAQESSFGTNTDLARNPTRNVMQSLATGNATLWLAAGINPYDGGMFAKEGPISYKMLDGKIETDGALVVDDFYKNANDNNWLKNERNKYHFNNITIIKGILEMDENNKYMVVLDNVTTNMSIAIGVGTLAHKISEKGSIAEGIMAYNKAGNTSYLEAINGHLSNMGCDEIEVTKNEEG